MVKKKAEEIVGEICSPIAECLGLSLIDVEYKKEGTNYVLRVIIDKPEGIVIEDCENLSRELSVKLDEVDPIPNTYNLEVQSPGERVLKKDNEFKYFEGRDVEVKLYEEKEGKRTDVGILKGVENGVLSIIKDAGEVVEFEMDKVASVRLKINF